MEKEMFKFGAIEFLKECVANFEWEEGQEWPSIKEAEKDDHHATVCHLIRWYVMTHANKIKALAEKTPR